MNFPQSIGRYLKTVVAKKKISLGQFELSEGIDEELAHPDFEPIERHFGCEVSPILKRHAADRNLVFTTEFEVASPWVRLPGGCHVLCFSALNAKSVDGFFEGLENYIAIARGIIGGEFVVDPRENNPMVYLHFWDVGRDPGRFRYTGLRLRAFLYSPRYPSTYEDELEICE
jgi:hypothetical protein